MSLRDILTLFRMPHLRTQLRLKRDVDSFLRLHFLYAATESGLLQTLGNPATREEIIRKLDVRRPELLDGLLELGVSLKELSRAKERYEICGNCSLALTAGDGDPLRALIQEYITYHGSVFRHFAARLKGAPPGDYLAETGDMIARSSRVAEPFVGRFVKTIIRDQRPRTLFEIGCGSGIYLRHAAEMEPTITGVAIDVFEDVVEQASANLAKWGIGDRFKVITADMHDLPADITGPFDLVTLYNNIYYFTPEERVPLFRKIRSLLAPDGALALVSMMRGNTIMASEFDLVLRSTLGCAPLPELDETIMQLQESGFNKIKKTRLGFGEPFYGILAR